MTDTTQTQIEAGQLVEHAAHGRGRVTNVSPSGKLATVEFDAHERVVRMIELARVENDADAF